MLHVGDWADTLGRVKEPLQGAVELLLEDCDDKVAVEATKAAVRRVVVVIYQWRQIVLVAARKGRREALVSNRRIIDGPADGDSALAGTERGASLVSL